MKLEHVWFGLMRLPEGTISTREGKLIGLEALLDEAETRALQIGTKVQAERDPAERLPEASLPEIARVVGIGAVKYADLLPNRQSDYIFSWDKMLALNGNTAPPSEPVPTGALARSCGKRQSSERS